MQGAAVWELQFIEKLNYQAANEKDWVFLPEQYFMI